MELSVHINDKIKLYSKAFLSSYHSEVVNLLYQPIIGLESINLYFTLWNLINIEKGELIVSYRQLLTFFNWSLKKFITVRERLEAIGLINVYYHKTEGYYLFELKQPLSARQFFLDSNLNIHLLYQVGDNMYEYLERKFLTRPLEDRLVNITKNFTDVYQILDNKNNLEVDNKEYVTTTINNFSIPLNYDFDFELFSLYVSRQFINTDELSQDVKDAIVKEAALYQFDPQMMSVIVLECIDNNIIDLNRLHEIARDYYKRLKIKTNSVIELKPAMTELEFSNYLNKKRLTNKEKALRNYKTKTPLEYLSFLQGNTEVPSSMIEVVNMIYTDYKLPGEVINVLIEFVRIRNDGRLPKEYTKTIASSWVFKQITSAEQAIEMVEKIQAKELEYTSKGQVAPTYQYKKVKHVVEVPAWMKEDNITEQKSQNNDSVDLEELKKLLESFK